MTDRPTDELTRGELAEWVHRNPSWYDEDPGECVVCDREAVPVALDGVFVPTPNGSACLSLKEPSCLTCRVNAAENLQRRGRNQRALNDFGGDD